MDIFVELAQRIIKAQENVIGPLALEQARKVDGIQLDSASRTVSIQGSEKDAVDRLIKQYEGVFGMASIEVCRDAVKEMIPNIPHEQMPTLLQS